MACLDFGACVICFADLVFFLGGIVWLWALAWILDCLFLYPLGAARLECLPVRIS